MDIVLPVPDLDTALAFFVDELGFRIDRIWPADDPGVAQISGHDVRIELRRHGDAAEIPDILPPLVPTVEISRIRDAEWGVGRAGMQYRDLLPSRQGGHFIASHIRIPGSGPVPDWVHFHEVTFQMIFCFRGRVRVAYEDQGPPFEMVAGDCILQPPKIRHRVIESHDDLQIIEIGGPAQHITGADHDLSLPNALGSPARLFSGQRFVRSIAADATWLPREGLEVRDLGIRAATDGLADVTILRGSGSIRLEHPGRLLFLFVLDGSVQIGRERLETGDSIALAGRATVECDGEFLSVAV